MKVRLANPRHDYDGFALETVGSAEGPVVWPELRLRQGDRCANRECAVEFARRSRKMIGHSTELTLLKEFADEICVQVEKEVGRLLRLIAAGRGSSKGRSRVGV